jgi:hypothetical protein
MTLTAFTIPAAIPGQAWTVAFAPLAVLSVLAILAVFAFLVVGAIVELGTGSLSTDDEPADPDVPTDERLVA